MMEQIRSRRVLTPSLRSEINPHMPISKASRILREKQQRDNAMARASTSRMPGLRCFECL